MVALCLQKRSTDRIRLLNSCGRQVEHKQLFSVLLWQENKSLGGGKPCFPGGGKPCFQVPGSVSRLLKVYQRWARVMPDCTLGAHPRSSAKPLPLPLHAWLFLLFPKNVSTYTSRDPAHLPRPCPLPPCLLPVQMGSISAWLRSGAAVTLSPEKKYQRAHALESDQTGFYQTGWTRNRLTLSET